MTSSSTTALPPYPPRLKQVYISHSMSKNPPTEPITIPTTVPGAGPALRPAYVVGMARICCRRTSFTAFESGFDSAPRASSDLDARFGDLFRVVKKEVGGVASRTRRLDSESETCRMCNMSVLEISRDNGNGAIALVIVCSCG